VVHSLGSYGFELSGRARIHPAVSQSSGWHQLFNWSIHLGKRRVLLAFSVQASAGLGDGNYLLHYSGAPVAHVGTGLNHYHASSRTSSVQVTSLNLAGRRLKKRLVGVPGASVGNIELLLEPILQTKFWNPGKFLDIVGYQNQTVCNGLCSYERV
jgi:hypothetical protein